jgi:hypothetical protein
MASEDRSWCTPELSVLVRGEPEESVLTSCKAGGVPGASNQADRWCVGQGADCVECNTVVAS